MSFTLISDTYSATRSQRPANTRWTPIQFTSEDAKYPTDIDCTEVGTDSDGLYIGPCCCPCVCIANVCPPAPCCECLVKRQKFQWDVVQIGGHSKTVAGDKRTLTVAGVRQIKLSNIDWTERFVVEAPEGSVMEREAEAAPPATSGGGLFAALATPAD